MGSTVFDGVVDKVNQELTQSVLLTIYDQLAGAGEAQVALIAVGFELHGFYDAGEQRREVKPGELIAELFIGHFEELEHHGVQAGALV